MDLPKGGEQSSKVSLQSISGEKKRGVYLKDIDFSQEWPSHLLHMLNRSKELNYKIHFREICSVLAQICIVEVGLVPAIREDIPTASEISDLDDSARIPMLCDLIPFNAYNEKMGIFNLEFFPIFKKLTLSDTEEEDGKFEEEYIYSEQRVKIILMNSNGSIDSYGSFQDPLHPKALTHHASVDIQSCIRVSSSLTTDVSAESTLFTLDEWRSRITIDGPRLSTLIKTNFVIPLMDLIGAVSFEIKGLQSLPPELLNHILIHCDIRTILNLSMTSKYLHNLVKQPTFWAQLIYRDFKTSLGKKSLSKQIEELSFCGKPPSLKCLIELYRKHYSEEQRKQNRSFFNRYFSAL